MKTNEVISYNKNLITGDTITGKKRKKDKGIKGKVLLELFDAKSNKKVKEAYTENIIPDLYFKDTFIRSFVQGVMGSGDIRNTTNYNWFNYLYLTDHDKPENVNDQRVMGNIIGYAHRNNAYSGEDTKRGTINRVETHFEITDNKIKINFVFDFPTHAANGIIESIYWADSDPNYKDYFYVGACLYSRENGDLSCIIDDETNPKRYWAINKLFTYAKKIKFTSSTKGWILLDGNNLSVTQTNFIQFPDSLKGHMLMIPFDLNINDIVIWDKIVKLLNCDGNPLVIDSTDPVRKYDGLISVCPYIEPDENLVFIGYYTYSVSSQSIMRIYKWSKVGVQLSYVDLNMSQTFKDLDYNILFTYRNSTDDGVYNDGYLDIIGYTSRIDEQYNENIYTSRWIRVDALGNKVQDINVKPKIGSSTWFEKVGMDSGNIERRAIITYIYRSANRIYLSYGGTQGGSSFYQTLSKEGNLLEPYRTHFGLNSASYTLYYNIIGTDNWITRFYSNNNDNLRIQMMLTSKPIGAHTKLVQPVEKTDANTMKIQYMFEIDIIDYGSDYF